MAMQIHSSRSGREAVHGGRRVGFTLVELLVVVSVIALLIAILLPSLKAARESAKKTVCSSHMRQLATAAVEYTADNDDWLNALEDTVQLPSGEEVEPTYRVYLSLYIHAKPELFDCPSERVALYADGISASDASYAGITLTPDEDWASIYGRLHKYERWNASGIGVGGVHWIRKSDPNADHRAHRIPFGRQFSSRYKEGMCKYSWIRTPTKLIWFGDGGSGTSELWGDDSWWIKYAGGGYAQGDPGFNRKGQNDYGCERHGGQANYLFADGHARSFAPDKVSCDEAECWWSMRLSAHRDQVALSP
jgi:prepilin-type processing-associated H-X9-DG protein/prepilin-type N-terminal cleavage/methylation domain-containing protein